MKDAGIYGTTSAAVEQSRTAYAQVMASLPDIRQSIRETENALCLMLHQPAQSIARGVLEEQQLPTEFSVGILAVAIQPSGRESCRDVTGCQLL